MTLLRRPSRSLESMPPRAMRTEKVNADGYRLSVEGGLFAETERKFLLRPEENRADRWFCVRVQIQWDIMSKAAAGLLMAAHPAARSSACSRPTDVLCFATTWEHDITTSC